MAKSKYRLDCVVCGRSIASLHHNYRSQTCGDNHCRAVLLLTPELTDPMKTRKHPPGYVKDKERPYGLDAIHNRLRESIRLWATTDDADSHHKEGCRFDMDTSDWAFGDEYMTADLRGVGNPQSQGLWGFLSRTAVAFRGRTKESAIWLRIQRKPDESTADAIRRTLMGNTGWDDIYDVFLAWRCLCNVQSEYIVEKLDDIPDAVGPHGNCPACGATPLYVEVLSA